MVMRAIRGAIQVDSNSAESIGDGVKELISAIMRSNSLTPDSVISVIFTSTPDLTAAFPAADCREIGFESVPLIGAVEVAVPGALARTVRVMLHCETTLPLTSVSHVYLRGAQSLRRDIAQ